MIASGAGVTSVPEREGAYAIRPYPMLVVKGLRYALRTVTSRHGFLHLCGHLLGRVVVLVGGD